MDAHLYHRKWLRPHLLHRNPGIGGDDVLLFMDAHLYHRKWLRPHLLHRNPEIGEDDVLPDPLERLKQLTVDLKSASLVSVEHLKETREPSSGVSVSRFECLAYRTDARIRFEF